MSEREPHRACVGTLFRAINDHDPDAVVATYAPDAAVDDAALGVVFRGSGELSRVWTEWMSAIPDLRLDLDPDLFFTSGKNAAYNWTFSGNLLGDLPGLSAKEVKDSSFSVRGASLLEFSEDHLIRREFDHWDLAGMLRQLGLPLV